MTPYAIRSTLYMPATQNKLAEIISRPEKTHADAIVLRFEDALPINDINKGIANLNHAFAQIRQPVRRPYIFIRVRHINNFHDLLNQLNTACNSSPASLSPNSAPPSSKPGKTLYPPSKIRCIT